MRQQDIDIAQQEWIEQHARTHPRALQVGCGMKPIAGAVNLDPNPDRRAWVDVVGDAHRLPFQDGSFHSVVSSHVLPHLRWPVVALSEMARVLAPCGEMAHVVPDLRFAPRRCSTVYPFANQPHGWYGPADFAPVAQELQAVFDTLELVTFDGFDWSFKWRAMRKG